MKLSNILLHVAGFGCVALLGWAWAEEDKIKQNNYHQIVAVAEDLGCSYIEQSFKHPQNFYIDCGDDNIRIIKLEK